MQQNVTGPEECMNPTSYYRLQNQMAFKAKNSYAKRILTEQLYIKHLLHRRVIYIHQNSLSTLDSFLHRHLIHRKLRQCQLRNKISTEDCFTFSKKTCLQHSFGQRVFDNSPSWAASWQFAPKSVKYVYTKHLLLQTPFTPATCYTKKPKKGRQFHVVRWLQPNRKERI